jgi:hypothetical protein
VFSFTRTYEAALAQGVDLLETFDACVGGLMAATAQHMEALAHANEVRTGVAEFRP